MTPHTPSGDSPDRVLVDSLYPEILFFILTSISIYLKLAAQS